MILILLMVASTHTILECKVELKYLLTSQKLGMVFRTKLKFLLILQVTSMAVFQLVTMQISEVVHLVIQMIIMVIKVNHKVISCLSECLKELKWDQIRFILIKLEVETHSSTKDAMFNTQMLRLLQPQFTFTVAAQLMVNSCFKIFVPKLLTIKTIKMPVAVNKLCISLQCYQANR